MWSEPRYVVRSRGVSTCHTDSIHCQDHVPESEFRRGSRSDHDISAIGFGWWVPCRILDREADPRHVACRARDSDAW